VTTNFDVETFAETTISLKELDIRHWPLKHVKGVCKLVAEQVPKPQTLMVTSSSRKVSQTPALMSPVTPMIPFTPMTPLIDTLTQQARVSASMSNGLAQTADVFPGPGQRSLCESNGSGRPLIIIDAHPQQRRLADEIRRSLELDEFQVWCSCDSQADSGVEMDSPESGGSDANLSTIVECNELGHGASGRSTLDSLPSPDPSHRVTTEKFSKPNLATLDIPTLAKRPLSTHNSSPARSRHSTPNRSPRQSVENLSNANELETNASLKILNGNKIEFCSNAAAHTPLTSTSTSPASAANLLGHNTSRGLLPNPRPTSLPVGNCDVPLLGERKRISRLFSQLSDITHLNTLTPDKMNRLKRFQDKVTSAEVVIVLVSAAYFASRTSQKHAYYCEHRKKMILVRVDESKVSPWFANLMGEDIGLCVSNPRYLELLRNRVRRKADGGLMASSSRDIAESKLQYLVSYMKKNLPVLDTCVYVIGSTRLQSERSTQICRAIGHELAKLRNVTVVTSGFYGAGDLVARAFYESRRQKLVSEPQTPLLPQPPLPPPPPTPILTSHDTGTPCGRLADKWAASFRSQVVHILPLKEQRDFSDRCPQNGDGTFDPRDYGETLFLGECMKERETVVARLLNTCIVIEGGPGTASEAEEFIWNDSYVIPVMSTGGAASGQFGVPMKIFECPTGVNEQDWQMLADSHATPEEVARSVVRILVHLKQSIAACAKFHQLEQIGVTNGSVLGALGSLGLGAGVKVKKSLRKKRLSEKLEQLSRTPSIASVHLEALSVTGNYTPSTVSGIGAEMLPMMQACSNTRVKSSKWWRVQNIIPFASKKM
jgi:predicted Rossmann-fold nucleotide-binding protein